jgi:2-oxo-4-hydroxy-4-carboxy-5-ureidoimidazoline decarboxylase
MTTLENINSLPRADFVKELGWIFEHSPWVAEQAWRLRPFPNIDALHAALVTQVDQATHDQQLALLRAHPDLGARVRMSEASTEEQAGAGLDRLTPEEFDRLQSLNGSYREKFGFPFLYAVKGSRKHDILAALAQRVNSSPQEEFREALRQVYRIASFRLHENLTVKG